MKKKTNGRKTCSLLRSLAQKHHPVDMAINGQQVNFAIVTNGNMDEMINHFDCLISDY